MFMWKIYSTDIGSSYEEVLEKDESVTSHH